MEEKIKGKGCLESALTSNNIASVYAKQKDYPKAIKYYRRCLDIYQQHQGKSTGTANTLNNLGNVYQEQGDHWKAIEYYTKCL